MSNDLVPATAPKSLLAYEDPAARFKMICSIAAGLRRSNLLPEAIKTDEQAAVVMLYGDELGLKPMQSFDFINVVKGKPGISSKGSIALVRFRCPGIKIVWPEISKERCTIIITRPGEEPFPFTFTWEMAEQMKTYDNGGWIKLTEKSNWRSMPVQMMIAMTARTATRIHCPDLTGGLPSVEELEDEIVVDAPATVVASQDDLMPRARAEAATPRAATLLEEVLADSPEPADIGFEAPPPPANDVPRSGHKIPMPAVKPPKDAPKKREAPTPEPEVDSIDASWRKVSGMAGFLIERKAATEQAFWASISGISAVTSTAQAKSMIERAVEQGQSLSFLYRWVTEAIKKYRPATASAALFAITKKGSTVSEIEDTLCGGEDVDLWLMAVPDRQKVLTEVVKAIGEGLSLPASVEKVQPCEL